MPDRSKVTTQTKRDNLVLQFGRWGTTLATSPPQNKASLFRSLIIDARWIILVKDQGKDIRIKISNYYLECIQSIERRNVKIRFKNVKKHTIDTAAIRAIRWKGQIQGNLH